MRSALICVFFALVVQREGSRAAEDDDFKPTPIPLASWPGEAAAAAGAAGTLHEFIRTDAPPAAAAVAALPAHYWEDALRHSVYLTLVRDKIDQLIAKGAVISPDTKPDTDVPKEVDDHDLWEKIKAAPFDRLKEDPLPPGDVIILARGRLLEEKDGYRFAEDDGATPPCQKEQCTQPVKAYWSVKRVRQGEAAQGKYHYELTFSVTSQATKKLKKPYENPVRTFTIRENSPTDQPAPQSRHVVHYGHSDRAQRAVWFHKNIAPNHQKRPASSRGLDRIFSSLFSDDENYEDAPYRRKPGMYIPHVYPQQHAKTGYVGDRESYHQKKLLPYSIKPQPFRYSRPPLPPPPLPYVQHPYLDVDQGGFKPHIPIQPGKLYIPPNPIRTTKPAVLPTPITNFQLLKESTVDVPVRTTLNASDYTTKEPDVSTTTYKVYSHKQAPMKVSYFPENIRPPVYNAPPGVFVTMDKKPFKPMPPLKLMHSSKPHKTVPLDFRPSPQILDTSSSDADTSADTAFRPITLNLTELLNSKKGPKNHRKPTPGKKPPKKHDNIKPMRLTTVSPDIITADDYSLEDNDEMHWAEILGAFTKTTPMASHRERETPTDNDYITTTTAAATTTTEKPEEETTTSTTTTTTTTTAAPKPRRTRPPPKFTTPDKIKKHKRVTSTTTSTSTTAKPARKYPAKKTSDDLTPQASSAATSGANSVRETKHKGDASTTSSTSTTTTSSTTTTTTSAPTTTRTSTTQRLTSASPRTTSTTSTTSTTPEPEPSVSTTQPKSKNRFRQSTLMQKGTSVNHDKWSVSSALDKNKTAVVPTKFPLRRKASKFQGYIPSSTPRRLETERNREDHEDHGFTSNRETVSTTTEEVIKDIQVKIQQAAKPTADRSHNDDVEEIIEVELEEETENYIQESKDNKEYIFPATMKSPDTDQKNSEEKHSTTEQTVVASPHSADKNKTKCKKKKHNNLTTTESLKASSDGEATTVVTPTTSSASSTSTSTSSTASDILEELFGGFTMDDVTEGTKGSQTTADPEPSESESAKHEQYIPIDDDIEDFLHSLDHKDTKSNEKDEDDYDEEDDDEDSPFNNDDENSDSRNFNEEYYDDSSETHGQEKSQNRPYSLLELMAME